MSDSSRFLELLSNRILLFDGAMGTMLYSKGIFINRCFDELNLSSPDLVMSVHDEYVKAGADIIETNTFGANRVKLAPYGLDGRVKDINAKGVEIARKAGNKSGVLIAGSIGPLGKVLEPAGSISLDEVELIFAEQAKALADAGADILVLETFSNPNELVIAVQGVKSAVKIPVIAQLSIDEADDDSSDSLLQMLAQIGDDYNLPVIGLNCGMGPQGTLDAVEKLARLTNCKISAQPNAGEPRRHEGRSMYMATPEYFAEYAKRLIKGGASIIGGCCGTTPEHIRTVRNAIKAVQPLRASVSVDQKQTVETIGALPRRKSAERSAFGKKLGEKFVISVEIDPPRGISPEKEIVGAKLLYENGIDAVNIADGPRAMARMSPASLGILIKQRVGIDVILHYCCRDRNVLGMQADLIGANAIGIHDVLIITGDPPKLGNYPFATGVYDVDSIGLVNIADHLNCGLDIIGGSIGEPTSLVIGIGAEPGTADVEREAERYFKKVEAGADFLMTQPVFKIELLEKFFDLIGKKRIPTLVGILPLASYRNAEFLNNEVPGMSVPESILDRMRNAKSKEEAFKTGIDIAKEILKQTKDFVDGAYFMPPFGRYESVIEILQVL
jgi:methionine synthase / methylenetetrahydrofolate reductase(NADPH)